MVHYQLILFKGRGSRVAYLKQRSVSRVAYTASRDVTMACW